VVGGLLQCCPGGWPAVGRRVGRLLQRSIHLAVLVGKWGQGCWSSFMGCSLVFGCCAALLTCQCRLPPAVLCFVGESGEGDADAWASGEVGGYEAYLLADDDGEAAEVYKAVGGAAAATGPQLGVGCALPLLRGAARHRTCTLPGFCSGRACSHALGQACCPTSNVCARPPRTRPSPRRGTMRRAC
jgi:hypothetical protein